MAIENVQEFIKHFESRVDRYLLDVRVITMKSYGDHSSSRNMNFILHHSC